VLIIVDWDNFPIGASVFVPVIDYPNLYRQLDDVSETLKIGLETRHTIEKSTLGVRIWRIL
jgi:hypothetical protein